MITQEEWEPCPKGLNPGVDNHAAQPGTLVISAGVGVAQTPAFRAMTWWRAEAGQVKVREGNVGIVQDSNGIPRQIVDLEYSTAGNFGEE